MKTDWELEWYVMKIYEVESVKSLPNVLVSIGLSGLCNVPVIFQRLRKKMFL